MAIGRVSRTYQLDQQRRSLAAEFARRQRILDQQAARQRALDELDDLFTAQRRRVGKAVARMAHRIASGRQNDPSPLPQDHDVTTRGRM